MAVKPDPKKGLKNYADQINPINVDHSKQLAKNQKLQTFKVPAGGNVTPVTPLVSMHNPLAQRTQQMISQFGGDAQDDLLGRADAENKGIIQHNLNVDDKIRQEELQRQAAEALARMQAAEHQLKSQGGNAGSKFSMDGIGGGDGVYKTKGLTYHDMRGNTGKINATQDANINAALAIADKRGLSDYEKKILVSTMMAESGAINVKGGDRDSAGLFQQRPSQGWGSYNQVTDINYSTNKFITEMLKVNPKGKTGWEIAQATQRSAYSGGQNYKNYWDFADRVVNSYQNNPVGTSVKANAGLTTWLTKQNGKYHDWDKKFGTQCVDFFRYYVNYLGFEQPPGMTAGGGGGGAKELWNNPTQRAAMSRNFVPINKNKPAQPGDVVVFSGAYGAGFGHVGVVISDSGGKLRVMNSNSSTVGNGKPTNIVTYNKNAVLGYYRPK